MQGAKSNALGFALLSLGEANVESLLSAYFGLILWVVGGYCFCLVYWVHLAGVLVLFGHTWVYLVGSGGLPFFFGCVRVYLLLGVLGFICLVCLVLFGLKPRVYSS